MKSASATILAGDFFFLSEIEFREILHINKILLCAYVCSLIWFAIKLILFPASCTFLFSAFFSLSLSFSCYSSQIIERNEGKNEMIYRERNDWICAENRSYPVKHLHFPTIPNINHLSRIHFAHWTSIFLSLLELSSLSERVRCHFLFRICCVVVW